ncbi:hypothetical protein J2128_001290 [Methanomicrobium sp. W14]|uniref:hypothetical protein n=1 Tax=Methanomicrobium sp. W14 TaxID=2817839 RepID=UPI001AE72E73|nr:hypothetical protein [Methanomicrobium sp. W14]MBP2133336.1 hypothetical protein [Methanomicrobium sp. W14]
MGIDEAKKDLDAYISALPEKIPPVSGSIGHLIASMLIGYRTGLYDRAIGRADRIIKKLGNDEKKSVLKCAVKIIRNRSIELLPSQKSIRSEFNWEGGDPTKTYGYSVPEEQACRFSEGDEKYYAVILNKEDIRVPPGEYEYDNALILAYSCAYISSPEDRLALEEQVLGYVLQRIEYYKSPDL